MAAVACDIGWSDIGSWEDFGKLYPKDSQDNHCQGEVLLHDSTNCVVHASSRLVTGIGLNDLIIADTPGALLIADKTQAQAVRTLVATLTEQKHPSIAVFPKVYRPWGHYTTLFGAPGFKIKQIEVKPGASLSLQSHKYRCEH